VEGGLSSGSMDSNDSYLGGPWGFSCFRLILLFSNRLLVVPIMIHGYITRSTYLIR